MLKKDKTLGIIPARFLSTRFPGKPLVDIAGKSMVQRVWEQANQAATLTTVVVATDDERIFDHVHAFGGKAMMTSPTHLSGTDRCAEVADNEAFEDYSFIVNIQGDEPFIQPAQIDLAVRFLMHQVGFSIATLAKKIEKVVELFNPNVVKVVFDQQYRALYFSRSIVPFLRNVAETDWLEKGLFYKHIGLYVFRRETLAALAKLPAGRLEQAESLEQLRWLEAGFAIGIEKTEFETQGIDAPEDLKKIINAL